MQTKPSQVLSARQRAILLGSLLGDGWLKQSGACTASFGEIHAEDQRGYLQWKQEIWGEAWVTPYPIFQKAPKPTHQDAYGFRTRASEVLRPWYDLFYQRAPVLGKYRTKTYPVEVVDEVTPLALAVWYMDDGCAAHWPRLTTEVKNHSVGLAILQAFGFEGTATPGPSAHIEIRGVQQAERFLALIRPHQHPDLEHKWHPVALGGLGQGIPADELQDFVRAGATMQDLQSRYGVGKPTLQIRLRELGIQGTASCSAGLVPDLAARVIKVPPLGVGQGRPSLELPKELLEDLLGSGHSVHKMAQRFGLSDAIVARELDRHGLVRPDRRGGAHRTSPQITVEGLQQALDQGLKLYEMAARFGVHPATIRLHLKRLNLGG